MASTDGRRAGLGLSPRDVESVVATCKAEGIPVFGVRFTLGHISSPEKFNRLHRLLGEPLFLDWSICGEEYLTSDGERLNKQNAHSVFCGDFVDRSDQPTRRRFDELAGYLDRRLTPGRRQPL